MAQIKIKPAILIVILYNSNYNQNADYNSQFSEKQRKVKKKDCYELWFDKGDDKDVWT